MKALAIHLAALLLLAAVQPVMAVPESGCRAGALVQISETDTEDTVETLIELFSDYLGLAPGQLTAETDLALRAGLDPTDLHYALLEIYDSLDVPAPACELTRIDEIALYVDNADVVQEEGTRSVDGFGDAEDAYVQEVYFATNRQATGNPEPDLAFDGRRAADRAVSYGLAHVNMPRTHKKGRIERPFLKVRALNDERKHIFIRAIDNLDEERFMRALGSRAPDPGDLLVYIHGFNVAFDDAIRRAAQIAFDFNFEGAPISFTWPSDGGGVTTYNSDWQDVLWSVKYIERFLRSLSERFPDRKVHLIAHSMGNKGLLYAMRLIAYGNDQKPRFGNVMLCAPDFDAQLFAEQIAPEVRELADHWTVYSSRKDLALIASETLNAAPRLGMNPAPADGYDIIDASEVQVTPWSLPETHSYYATKQTVIKDMMGALAGVAPAERGLRSTKLEPGVIWLLQ